MNPAMRSSAVLAAGILSLLAAPTLEARAAAQDTASGGMDAIARQQANFAVECVGIYDLAKTRTGDAGELSALDARRQSAATAYQTYSGRTDSVIGDDFATEDQFVADNIAAGKGDLADIQSQCDQMFADSDDLADLSSLDDSGSGSSSSSSSDDFADFGMSPSQGDLDKLGQGEAANALTCVGVYDYAIARGGDATTLGDLKASRDDAAALYHGFAAKTQDEAAADYPGADASVAATIDGGRDTLPAMQASCDQMLVDDAGAA